ncbi:hypothetical protein Tco_0379179 [Tanacetum coccineum]
MVNFPRLDELAVAANSRGLFNGMLVYFDRENKKDLEFANVMTYKILKFLNKVQNHDVIQLLELRKIIVGTHRQVSRKIALIETIRTLQPWDVLYSRVNELRLLTSELNVFGGQLALQCAEFLKQLSQKEAIRMLELRKTIAEVHLEVYKDKFSYSSEVLFITLWIFGLSFV